MISIEDRLHQTIVNYFNLNIMTQMIFFYFETEY